MYRPRRLILVSLLPFAQSLAHPAASRASFTDIGAGLPGLASSSVACGDYDADGDLDVLLTGGSEAGELSRVYRNDGGGVFSDISAGLMGVSEGRGAWGDYDNDGDLDVVLMGRTGPNRVSLTYRNISGQTFVADAELEGLNNGAVALGDYDNDGDLDTFLAGYNGTRAVSHLYNNIDGHFTAVDTGIFAASTGSAGWGDYDNDGDLDILITGNPSSFSRLARVMANEGGGVFTDISAGLTGVGNSSAAWGDYDGDGDLDIVLTGTPAGGGDVARVYRNDGNGVFANTEAAVAGTSYGSVAWGDYDNDGDLDILITGSVGQSAVSRVYRNDAEGGFANINAQLPGVARGTGIWADYDNDGDLDILLSGVVPGSGAISGVYRNDGELTNTPPDSPGALAAELLGDRVVLTWSPSVDVQTPSAGLTYNLRIGTTPGGGEICSPMADWADGYRHVIELGNAQMRTVWALTVEPGRYFWSVQALDGAFAGSPFAVEQVIGQAGIGGSASPPWPATALSPCFPNPFGEKTAIPFELLERQRAKVVVYDTSGRRVRVLVDQHMASGGHVAWWDGIDGNGRHVASGSYICRIHAGTSSRDVRVALIR